MGLTIEPEFMYQWFGYWWVEDERGGDGLDDVTAAITTGILALIIRQKSVLRGVVNWVVN